MEYRVKGRVSPIKLGGATVRTVAALVVGVLVVAACAASPSSSDATGAGASVDSSDAPPESAERESPAVPVWDISSDTTWYQLLSAVSSDSEMACIDDLLGDELPQDLLSITVIEPVGWPIVTTELLGIDVGDDRWPHELWQCSAPETATAAYFSVFVHTFGLVVADGEALEPEIEECLVDTARERELVQTAARVLASEQTFEDGDLGGFMDPIHERAWELMDACIADMLDDAASSPSSATGTRDVPPATEQRFTLTGGLDLRTFVIAHEGTDDVEVTLHDCGNAELVLSGVSEKYSTRDDSGELPRNVRLTAIEAHGSFASVHKLGPSPAECLLRSNAALVEHIDEDGTELRLNGEQTAQFHGRFDYLTDPDIYKIELTRGETVRIWVESAEADTRLTVLDEDGSLVAADDDSGPQDFSGGGLFNPEIVMQTPQSGRYSLMVDYLPDSSISFTGSYQIFVQKATGADFLTEGGSAGSADPSSGLAPAGDTDQRFTLTGGLDVRTFVIDHEGSDDVDVTLHDCGDAEMAVAGLFGPLSGRDEDGELPRSVRLTSDEALLSFVTVSRVGSGSVECRLHSNTVLIEYLDEDGAGLQFRSDGNAQHSGGFDYYADYDVYVVDLSLDDTVTVWVDSPDADTGLILLDEDGNVVADDDDSGPRGLWNSDYNPQIVYQATASGRYLVAVGYSPLTSSSPTGSYTIIAARNN